MAATQDLRILMLGLPESGKTTFLAALWHRLNDPSAPSRLQLQALGKGDRSYLNHIADAWSRHEQVVRTPRNVQHKVEIYLKNGGERHGGTFVLEIPDLSGESFEEHLETRSWTTGYAELVERCRGLILFIHPDSAVQPHRIAEADEILGELEGSGVGDDVDPADLGGIEPPLPTAVALIELLQFHDAKRPGLPVAIAVSAWDLLEDIGESPEQFLEKRLPLLHQYLTVASATRPFTVFGVSAQGGDYETDREILVELNPEQRTRIRASSEQGNDLTLLIAWMAEQLMDWE